MALQYVCINNQLVEYSKAHIHISDLAIHRGIGVFDYFRFDNGSNKYLSWYFDRLYNSLSLAQLSIKYSREELLDQVNRVFLANATDLCNMKIIITGGSSLNGYDISSDTNIIVLSYPYKSNPNTAYLSGVKLLTTRYQRPWPEIKSINYFSTAILQNKMSREGAIDVLHIDNEQVRETSRSNIFMVKNQIITTPKNHILKGITRKSIVEEFDVVERDITLKELLDADEVFISSTTKGAMPIVQIDNSIIGEHVPGPICADIHKFTQSIFS